MVDLWLVDCLGSGANRGHGCLMEMVLRWEEERERERKKKRERENTLWFFNIADANERSGYQARRQGAN